jgi:hypothetical protein
MATLVYSARPGSKFIQSWEPTGAQKLFNDIIRAKFYQSSVRVNFRYNRYNYQPTDDYKNYVIRFRGIQQI